MEYDFYVKACALAKIFWKYSAVGIRLCEAVEDIREIFTMERRYLESMISNGDELIGQILDPAVMEWSKREVEWCMNNGVKPVFIKEKEYPKRLSECCDAPIVLYRKGCTDLNSKRSIAVVGTRRASYYGKTSCRKILERLSYNRSKPLIISGLALGIDGCAHKSALEFGLPTVAVMPTGMDNIYPTSHRELSQRIIASGGTLVTEFTRNTPPIALNFIRRNRIIAGMADATLVAESYSKGGSLITASHSNSYSREVFAVPGRMGEKSFEGCNKLISQNIAEIVNDVETIEKSMGWRSSVRRSETSNLFNPEDKSLKSGIIAILIEHGPMDAGEICTKMKLDLSIILTELLELEIAHIITVIQGNKYEVRQ